MARKRRTDTKGRVLKTGESERKDHQYVYRYIDPDGKRDAVYAPTLPELREKEQKVERDLTDGIDISKSNMTLNELFPIYLSGKTDLRASTRANYLYMWEKRVEHSALGRMPVFKIKPMHIKTFYADLTKNGYSWNTVKVIHNMINPTLQMAVENDIIRKNPARGCMKGVGGVTRERRALTGQEQDALVDYLKDNEKFGEYVPVLLFALSTGMRASEICGLRWPDVDMDQNIIHVRKQLIYKNLDGNGSEFCLCDPKTSAGTRDLPMTDTARGMLFRQKELNMMYGKRKEVEGYDDYVFLNSQGSPLIVNTLDKILKLIITDYNKEHPDATLPMISMHILRHSYLTRSAEAGMDAKVLQYLAGHESITTTMNIYVNYDYDQIKKQVEEIQSKVKFG